MTVHRAAQLSRDLIRLSGVEVTAEESRRLDVVHFGLENLPAEGVQTIDLVDTGRLRVKLSILLPVQAVPQHLHPPYDRNPGKEETIRAVYGSITVFVPGEARGNCRPPKGKEPWYTLTNGVTLLPAQQLTIAPGVEHWFRGGAEGAVAYSYYTQADEAHNRFRDPAIRGVLFERVSTG